MDAILFPIEHGVLFYPGMDVLPSVVFYEVSRPTSEAVHGMTEMYVKCLLDAPTTEPIPFRSQNGGDYNDLQVLRPEFAPGEGGLQVHQRAPVFVSNTSLGSSGTYTPVHIALTSRG